jgi:hypothetical protein
VTKPSLTCLLGLLLAACATAQELAFTHSALREVLAR